MVIEKGWPYFKKPYLNSDYTGKNNFVVVFNTIN